MRYPVMLDMPNAYLGFDFGMKRIGVAVGQSLTKTATPLPVLHANGGVPQWKMIEDLMNEWNIDAFIVGIPLNMDGTEQFTTTAARQFAQELAQRFQKPVHGMDERLSTVDVRQQVFDQGGYKALKKASIDSLAAQLILETWMRSHDSSA
jgi:putative Holliday junction resolvase